MNAVHFHLMLNHFPIVLSILGFLILSTGLILCNRHIKGVALAVLLLGALFSFMTSQSGERAEGIVKNIPGIEKQMIHEHEEKAEPFSALFYALGLISLISLWSLVKQKKYSKHLSILSLALCIPVIVLGFVVGLSGGEIRHTEIRKDAVYKTIPGAADSQKSENDDDKEEDH